MPPNRTNIQGRQKSCSECVKAKRRCDVGQPCCARCGKLNLTCAYPPQPHFKDKVVPAHESSDSSNVSTGIDIGDIGVAPFPFDLESLNDQPCPDAQFLDFDMSTAINSLDSLNTITNISAEEDRLALTRSRYSISTPSFFSANLSPYAKTRVGYSIEQLKLAPKSMVEENATLWSHAMLYEEYMPKPVQDVHAACALYLSRNEINGDFVARHVESRARELITAPLSPTPIETLARAHALMLYQIMLVFGGDIRLYSPAEALLPHLELAGNTLLSLHAEQTDPSGPIPLYPSATVRAEWSSFIFRESLRRTTVSLFQLVTLCGLLRGQVHSCAHELVEGNKITLSADLWNAKTAFDFGKVWNENRHFLVKELDFTEVLADGRPEDIDTFGKTILVGLRGLDDIKGWFHMHDAVF